MNSTLRDTIIFASGLLVGGVCTFFAIKKVYEAKADAEIEEVRKVYEEKIAEVEDHKDSLSGELEGPKEIEVKGVKSVSEIMNNKPDLKDYTKYFKAKGEKLENVTEALRDASDEIDPAEMEGPEEDIPYTEEEDLDQSLDYIDHELNGSSKKAIEEDLPPHLIDPSDYELTCANYDKMELIYHIYDDVLTNDDGEVVEKDSEMRLIGDIISETGFAENSDDVLYVRNDKIMSDFEVTKVFTPYERD